MAEQGSKGLVFPERFRAQAQGRVQGLLIAGPQSAARFEVRLQVEGSKPLPPAQTYPMTGLPRQALDLPYPDQPPLPAGTCLRLIWLGQRQVPGIEAGCFLRVSGLLSLRGDEPTIYNPRYEIIQAP